MAAQALADPRLRAGVAGGLSLFAIALGMLGVYGLMTFNVTQRTREIGIRMAVAAREAQIVFMVVRQAIVLTLAAARWLTTLLFGPKAADPVAAIAASFPPARRAARVDPATALRSE